MLGHVIMKKERCKYFIFLGLGGVISIAIAVLIPMSELFKGIAAMPAVGALCAALFQIWRDNAAYEKEIQLQQKQNLFNLGATSHMANTVFDKHVEFCEKYLAEVDLLVTTLTKEGPTQNALDHAGNLFTLRGSYTAWITPEIEEKLMPFEKAIREIGANANLVQMLRGESSEAKARLEAHRQMFHIFRNVMGISADGSGDETATIRAVKNKVREILGVDELVAVRDYLIRESAIIARSV